jgi:putative peptidoglycan lipid II flippase
VANKNGAKISRGLAQTAFIMAILMLASKLIGFVREVLMAYFFGASYVVDAYVVSYNVSTIVLEGLIAAVATAFVPMFSKKNEIEGPTEGNLFTSRTNNMLLVITLGISVISIIFSKQIVFIIANGWFGDPSKVPSIELAVFYVKITFIVMSFTSIANILESYLRYKNRFISPLLAGFPVNIGHIIFIFVAFFFDLRALVMGLLFGNMVRLSIDILLARKAGYRHKWDFHFGGMAKSIAAMSFPVFIGSTSEQINAFINRMLASWLPTGSVAALNYAFLLVTLVTGISGMVVFNLLYPKMAKAASLNDDDRWRYLFKSGFSIIFFLTVPISLCGICYSNLIVRAVFERSAFDAAATALTAPAFYYYSIGLVFIALIPFVACAFYSLYDTKTPVKIAVGCVVLNILCNLLFVKVLAHGGLALGTSIASIMNVALLLIMLQRKSKNLIDRKLFLKLAKIMVCSIIAIAISFGVHVLIGDYRFGLQGSWVYIVHIVILFAVTGVAYLCLLHVFKFEELKYVSQIFGRKNDAGKTQTIE